MSATKPELTPEQIQIREERARRKAEKALQTVEEPIVKILKREWIQIHPRPAFAMKIMTWNILARALVHRELFKQSDCLKRTVREPMLTQEILTYMPDIVCLQEVDIVDDLVKRLQAKYSHVYGVGQGKKHGCAIFFNKRMFEKTHRLIVHFDELDVNEPAEDDDQFTTRRRGTTRKTKNIGLAVALRRLDDPTKGCIVATLHAFWHPAYTYERTRQTGLLGREVARFQAAESLSDWPCFFAGDFNSSPTEAAYALLVGDPLSPEQEAILDRSRVIHTSIDGSIPETSVTRKVKDTEDDLNSTRPATDGDGLLSAAQLASLFTFGPLRSTYDLALAQVPGEADNVLGARFVWGQGRKGQFEPMYSSFTEYWQTIIDYIFIKDSSQQRVEVTGVLPTHRAEVLRPHGLPRKDICGSDHISLMVEVSF